MQEELKRLHDVQFDYFIYRPLFYKQVHEQMKPYYDIVFKQYNIIIYDRDDINQTFQNIKDNSGNYINFSIDQKYLNFSLFEMFYLRPEAGCFPYRKDNYSYSVINKMYMPTLQLSISSIFHEICHGIDNYYDRDFFTNLTKHDANILSRNETVAEMFGVICYNTYFGEFDEETKQCYMSKWNTRIGPYSLKNNIFSIKFNKNTQLKEIFQYCVDNYKQFKPTEPTRTEQSKLLLFYKLLKGRKTIQLLEMMESEKKEIV